MIKTKTTGGSKFLNDFGRSQFLLKNAEKALLECSKIDKRYNAKHKQLVRLRKGLNRWFSEEREKHEPTLRINEGKDLKTKL